MAAVLAAISIEKLKHFSLLAVSIATTGGNDVSGNVN
jgi:hypothetical protein